VELLALFVTVHRGHSDNVTVHREGYTMMMMMMAMPFHHRYAGTVGQDIQICADFETKVSINM